MVKWHRLSKGDFGTSSFARRKTDLDVSGQTQAPVDRDRVQGRHENQGAAAPVRQARQVTIRTFAGKDAGLAVIRKTTTRLPDPLPGGGCVHHREGGIGQRTGSGTAALDPSARRQV